MVLDLGFREEQGQNQITWESTKIVLVIETISSTSYIPDLQFSLTISANTFMPKKKMKWIKVMNKVLQLNNRIEDRRWNFLSEREMHIIHKLQNQVI